MPKNKDDAVETLRKVYEEQLARKDKMIEELKKREGIILNAMLREGQRNLEWKGRLERALKKTQKEER